MSRRDWLAFVQFRSKHLSRKEHIYVEYPTVTGAEKRVGGWLSGFRAFVLRGNVVDLAVGIVIGAAFTTVVNGFVSDVITPLIPVPGGSISTWKWPVPYNHSAFLNVGAFINAIISF